MCLAGIERIGAVPVDGAGFHGDGAFGSHVRYEFDSSLEVGRDAVVSVHESISTLAALENYSGLSSGDVLQWEGSVPDAVGSFFLLIFPEILAAGQAFYGAVGGVGYPEERMQQLRAGICVVVGVGRPEYGGKRLTETVLHFSVELVRPHPARGFVVVQRQNHFVFCLRNELPVEIRGKPVYVAAGVSFVNSPRPVDRNAQIAKDLSLSSGLPAAHIGSAIIYEGCAMRIGQGDLRAGARNAFQPAAVLRGQFLQGSKPVCAAPGHQVVVKAAPLVLAGAVLAPACLEPGFVFRAHGALQSMPDVAVLICEALGAVAPHKRGHLFPHSVPVDLGEGEEFGNQEVAVVVESGMFRAHDSGSGRSPVVDGEIEIRPVGGILKIYPGQKIPSGFSGVLEVSPAAGHLPHFNCGGEEGLRTLPYRRLSDVATDEKNC